MNTDTGRIYRGQEEIEAARERGEPVVEVSPQVAELMERAQQLKRDEAPSQARPYRRDPVTGMKLRD